MKIRLRKKQLKKFVTSHFKLAKGNHTNFYLKLAGNGVYQVISQSYYLMDGQQTMTWHYEATIRFTNEEVTYEYNGLNAGLELKAFFNQLHQYFDYHSYRFNRPFTIQMN